MNAVARKFEAIEVADDFAAELTAGMEFARAFYASGRKTVISSIPTHVLQEWDGDGEMALVADPDGIDLPDDVGVEDKAA